MTSPPPSGSRSAAETTPAMQQHRRFKEQYPDCVLFFRMGDFYELFFDDAILANKVLGVTLTQRTAGVPMAGVPYHAVENYLRRMIQAGHRVAVCDQMEDPKLAKGVVKRDVTRVVTPGTLTDEALLEEGRENPLAAVWQADTSDGVCVAWAELSTGDFRVAHFPMSQVQDELARMAPREILYAQDDRAASPAAASWLATAAQTLGCSLTARPGWQFRPGDAVRTIKKQFGLATLSGLGMEDDDPRLIPAAAVVHYLLETQMAAGRSGANLGPSNAYVSASPQQTGGMNGDGEGGTGEGGGLAHLQPPKVFSLSQYLVVDQVSLRSLEIDKTIRSNSSEGSLLGVLQQSRTAMGKRLLRHWLCYPLCRLDAIERRHQAVAAMVADDRFLTELRSLLSEIQDVQRILARVGVDRATPRDVVALGQSAAQARRLADLLDQRPSLAEHHQRLDGSAQELSALAVTVQGACVLSPPAHLREGGLFRDGIDAELDEYRLLQRDSHQWLAQYQARLIQASGIASLKVGFNRVFGYYIEMTAAQRDRIDQSADCFKGWVRKQTLKNAERFITDELKQFESKVLTAEQKAIAREQQMFADLCRMVRSRMQPLRDLAESAAELDVLACFAHRAVKHRYVRPVMVDEPVLEIRSGRHPVLDQLLGDRFVPNDLSLAVTAADASLPQARRQVDVAVITGPNMAGKSTFIRQAALITLLAHAGSFVPAESATIGLCDRIFTRIGASDELHAGASTFMVEMTETANICRYATGRSLVILDEIGRGTSTLDGLSLAWAVAEHLATLDQALPLPENPKAGPATPAVMWQGCRTLFATHYHEITTLAEQYPNVRNLHVSVREWQDQIVFLHRVIAGATDRSYGIHVAKIAGLPDRVIRRAKTLLGQLAVSHEGETKESKKKKLDLEKQSNTQLSLFVQYLEHPVLDKLRGVNIQELTPMQAFDFLRQLTDDLEGPIC